MFIVYFKTRKPLVLVCWKLLRIIRVKELLAKPSDYFEIFKKQMVFMKELVKMYWSWFFPFKFFGMVIFKLVIWIFLYSWLCTLRTTLLTT
jgi:hypothetical protein